MNIEQLTSFLAYESSMSSLSDSLVHAYATTDFKVFFEYGDAILNIGEPCSALDQQLLAKGAETAVILTAWNPHSKPTAKAANDSAQKELQQSLREYFVLPALGEEPHGEWPAEESFVIVDITYEKAVKLAQEYGQNAFVWYVLSSRAKLVLID
ncbi:MAG TPA: DUF3293 domain-containing protein [Aliidiomarina sp.]|nr:DUF3293 domain-containing protein [Aliidiomarina sp.]